MKYSWYAKNYGKDFIYQTRLKLWNNKKPKTSVMYNYITAAELGIILN